MVNFNHNKITLFPVLILLLTGCTTILGRRKRDNKSFKFSDCGSDPNRPILFHHVKIHPNPIVTPGTLELSMAGNITHDLPRRISIEMKVTKYFFNRIPFSLPCFENQIGSCTYDNICQNLERFEKRQRCPKRLRHLDIQCYCPFHAGVFSVKNLAVNIPRIGGYAGSFVKVRGDYAVNFRILDEDSGELGCLNLRFAMKKRNKGWLFRI
ncbi:ganglioside GM2 activator-like isoform X1 [Mytilus galloprovincialis]|uniref:GM2A n=1 Tax=Mytilus edulis TaxID=6550 RepID=A0A8S3VQZ4_MYTED|nr:GM2A [Mytilus edulis]